MIRKHVIYIVYIISAVFFLGSLYNLYYSQRILPGVYLNGKSFANLTKAEAEGKIKQSLPPESIVFKSESFSYTLSFEDIGMKYSAKDTVEKLFSSGRESYFSQFKNIAGFFVLLKDSELSFDLDIDSLNMELATLAPEKYPKHKDAYFNLDGNVLAIKEASEGEEINTLSLEEDILSGLPKGIVVYKPPIISFKPSLYAKDLEGVKIATQNFVNSKLEMVYEDKSFALETDEKLAMLAFKKVNGDVSIVPDLDGISFVVNKLSSEVNEEPKGTVITFDDKGKINFEPPITGVLVVEEDLSKELKNYIEGFNFTGLTSEVGRLQITVEKAKPKSSENDYGISERLAEGVSYFRGSSSNRIHNITTASEKISGSLISPGKNFSFNDSVGPITLAEGFNESYIISKGRTVLGTGGGVCQVSTTVYRAALNAGLPIVDRTAHAYRVSYYEQNSSVGLDATIYQPSVDLVFKNDTEHHILVYTVLDTKESKLLVKIYGTGDGRQVEVTKPKILNQLPPPDPVYEDDPNLPEGSLVQEEYPAWGGSVVYSRIVKNSTGEIMYEDEFKNYYKPWPAVYKKGIKKD